jgi:hypothetical protein
MPGTVIGKSLNLGYPGTVSRSADCVIAARQIKATDPNGPKFGDPLVLNADSVGGTLSSLADFLTDGGTFTAAHFAGVAVREVKVVNTYFPVPASAGYLPGDIADAIERGSVSVKVNVGTPVSQGTVYVRILANAGIPAGVVGGFEAAADGTNTVALTNVVFRTGNMDANGVAEITLTSRVAA